MHKCQRDHHHKLTWESSSSETYSFLTCISWCAHTTHLSHLCKSPPFPPFLQYECLSSWFLYKWRTKVCKSTSHTWKSLHENKCREHWLPCKSPSSSALCHIWEKITKPTTMASFVHTYLSLTKKQLFICRPALRPRLYKTGLFYSYYFSTYDSDFSFCHSMTLSKTMLQPLSPPFFHHN